MREFLEIPARHLYGDVIECGFKIRARCARDRIRELFEGASESEFRGDECKRIPSCFRREFGAPREPRIHFDHLVGARARVESVLDIALSDDAKVADDTESDVRSRWYSWLSSVWLGATTMDSPVWIPRGSTFSILQTVMQLSAASRTTSYSISFQPVRSSSMRTVGDSVKVSTRRSCRAVWEIARPLPFPPSAKDLRAMTGYPSVSAARSASFIL